MNIVTGSGRGRKIFEFPCAKIVKGSPKSEQKQAHTLLCDLLGVNKSVEKRVA